MRKESTQAFLARIRREVSRDRSTEADVQRWQREEREQWLRTASPADARHYRRIQKQERLVARKAGAFLDARA